VNANKAAACLFVAALAFASGCSLLPEERVEEIPVLIEPPPSRVVAYPVERGLIVEEVRGLARVAAVRETELYFRQAGRLAELNVRVGDRVAQGQVLARLETGSLERDIQIAEIDMEIARLQLERVRSEGLPYQIRIEELNFQKDMLSLEWMKERLEMATLRAPYDGVVQNVRAQQTQQIQEYQPIIVVADPSALQLQMEVRNVEQAGKLARGQEVEIELRQGRTAKGYVVQVDDPPGTTTTSAFGTKMVYIETEQSPASLGLRLGDLVNVSIAVRKKEDALIIPRAALREFMGRTYVRVLDGEARREVDVEVGIQTPTHVEILRGLSEGDLVIGR